MGTRSHFVPGEPVRISLPDEPEEWIEIRQRLTVGQKAALEASVIDIRTLADKGEMQIGADVGRFLNLQLRVWIVGWRLLDDAGQPIPFDAERITDLDAEDPLVALVVEEIGKRSPFRRTKTSGASA